MGRFRKPVFLFFWMCLFAGAALAQVHEEDTQHGVIGVEVVTQGLRHPWGMAFLPNGDMLVTERAGRLRRIRKGRLEREAIAGVPAVVAGGQGGLLDVALHPQFEKNGWVYLSYTGGSPGKSRTEVCRARLRGNTLKDVTVIFKAEPVLDGSVHFGSRLLFDREGYLYITLGERYRMKEAQVLSNHLGSVVRLHDNGKVPVSNPFVTEEDAKPEIYTYGHRNVQGIALDPRTGKIWVHEHGPKGGDELNILIPGANYGWPRVTFGRDYNNTVISPRTSGAGFTDPVIYWTPSIAPSGMTMYTGEAFPQWYGSLFVGALAGRHLRRIQISGDKVVSQEVLLRQVGERIRDVDAGPDGLIYVLTDEEDGKVLRVRPR